MRLSQFPLSTLKETPADAEVISHQLTQYYGRYARPGGGICVLERPGVSMACRLVSSALPPGSCQHLDVSYDGSRLLFAFCEAAAPPRDTTAGHRGHAGKQKRGQHQGAGWDQGLESHGA